MRRNILSKKLFIFDLDGTLTESKAPMDFEMALLLNRLLEKKSVAVIGGGSFDQFRKQFIHKLKAPKSLLKNLFLFPTTSTAFYRFLDDRWRLVYSDYLNSAQKKKIVKAFDIALKRHGYKKPERPYGKIIEDRGSQIAFSALGQDPPKSRKAYAAYLEAKKRWNKKEDIRPQIMKTMKKYLPEFEVKSGGLTTIDVTKKGIDKAYGVREIKKHLRVSLREAVFIGDALYPGGNDYAAKKTGVDCIRVSGPEETKRIIKKTFS